LPRDHERGREKVGLAGKLELLAELTDIMSDGVSQDLWILSIGVDNNPWGQYQPLIPQNIFVNFIYVSENRAKGIPEYD
jgi:hypothetical protein